MYYVYDEWGEKRVLYKAVRVFGEKHQIILINILFFLNYGEADVSKTTETKKLMGNT